MLYNPKIHVLGSHFRKRLLAAFCAKFRELCDSAIRTASIHHSCMPCLDNALADNAAMRHAEASGKKSIFAGELWHESDAISQISTCH